MRTETTTNETVTPVQATKGSASGASRWTGGIASVLSAAATIICPACIPTIASLLSSIGLGFAVRPSFLNPAVVVLLVISIVSLAWVALRNRRRWVLLVGITGAVLIYISRFVVFVPAVMWTGAALLIGAAVLNFLSKRPAGCGCAGNCQAKTPPRPPK